MLREGVLQPSPNSRPGGTGKKNKKQQSFIPHALTHSLVIGTLQNKAHKRAPHPRQVMSKHLWLSPVSAAVCDPSSAAAAAAAGFTVFDARGRRNASHPGKRLV